MKWAVGVATLSALAALTWHFREAPIVQQVTAPLRAQLRAGPGASPGSQGGALRKCLLEGRPIYTDTACPAGSREQTLTGGSVSVLPALPAPASAAPAAIGHARDLLVKPGPSGEADLKAQRIEAIVHK